MEQGLYAQVVKLHQKDLKFIAENNNKNEANTEEHLKVVKRRSLIVSLVMVLGVRPVCPAADVCISSVLHTRGTLQYVGIKTPLQTAAALLNPFSQNF